MFHNLFYTFWSALYLGTQNVTTPSKSIQNKNKFPAYQKCIASVTSYYHRVTSRNFARTRVQRSSVTSLVYLDRHIEPWQGVTTRQIETKSNSARVDSSRSSSSALSPITIHAAMQLGWNEGKKPRSNRRWKRGRGDSRRTFFLRRTFKPPRNKINVRISSYKRKSQPEGSS